MKDNIIKTNKIVLGVLAHVDAGKTTLSEQLLYRCKSIRKMGRVDHGDTLFDNHSLERERGITIFSKQAELVMGQYDVTLLDTPGHVDFQAETQRAVSVLDYAILIVSAADGVLGHTMTLWKMLRMSNIPTFIFVNKMDQVGVSKEKVYEDIKRQLSDKCIDFSEDNEELSEQLAESGEELMDEYLATNQLSEDSIRRAIDANTLFPCFFGSALKGIGIEEFIRAVSKYMNKKEYGEDFAAKVFKIGRDSNNTRLTYLKVTGGIIKVKMEVSDNADTFREKIDQIRIYQGGQYKTVAEAGCGSICVVTGLSTTRALMGLGAQKEYAQNVLEPVLNYKVIYDEAIPTNKVFARLKELEEENPELNVSYNEQLGEIHCLVMGEVQIDILRRIVAEKFDLNIDFSTGSVVYKETVEGVAEGVGHFEPLKHYAEVHIKIEPLKRGEGIQFATNVSEDELDRNWQRLIMTHLEEKKHKGILTGSQLTDVLLTIVAGRAHKKHTEGGDFRQATYRAVRHAALLAGSKLLEPYYSFRIEVPTENIGRVLTDVQNMYGEFEQPQTYGETSVVTGIVPVSTINGYSREVNSYTRGRGSVALNFYGYGDCHNQDEVIEQTGYDFEADSKNPVGSVFCRHGAGFIVPWDEVYDYMHLPLSGEKKKIEEFDLASVPVRKTITNDVFVTTEEIDEIMERTYGKREERVKWKKTTVNGEVKNFKGSVKYLDNSKERYLLVDGYNIIFSWKELNELSKDNMEAARLALLDEMCNYQGYTGDNVIVVFDAYRVKGGNIEKYRYNNIDVIFTRESQTADSYIERVTHELGKKYRVKVATSDALEQCIIWGNGAIRLSAGEFREEIDRMKESIREKIDAKCYYRRGYYHSQRSGH